MSNRKPDDAENIFQDALDREPETRERYVKAACGTNAELRAEVENLLRSSDRVKNTPGRDKDSMTPTLPLAAPPEIGMRVGAYRLTRELGHGGMGTVYLGERADQEFGAVDCR